MNSLTRQTHIITMPLKQIPSTNETESASSQSEKKRCEGHKKQKRQAVYKPVSLDKSGLLPYFAQNPFNSIKFEDFLCSLISARYKMIYSSNQEGTIILITNYHAKNTPKIW